MKPLDMLKICLDNKQVFDIKKLIFLKSLLSIKAKNKGKLILTDAQYQYLQACYDFAIEKSFGLESMTNPKKWK